MADIFTLTDVQNMLKKKRVVFFGDSNIRAIYKDLVCLVKSNTFLRALDLKSKLEPSFMGDKLLKRSPLTRGRDFQEHRQFKTENICLEFYFITRSYCKTVEDVVKAIKEGEGSPVDIIVMNSCLWDLSRWGPNGVCSYKENLLKLVKFLNKNLPQQTLFIWTTALPISQNCYGGFLIKQVEFLKHTLRFEVMEANIYARDVVASHGYDVLDLHYYFTMQICRRAKDGIHWCPEAVRFMTNLLLTHTALSWHYPLPGNIFNSLLDDVINLDNNEVVSENQLQELPPCLDIFSSISNEPGKTTTRTGLQVKSASAAQNKTRPKKKKPSHVKRRKQKNRPIMKEQQHQTPVVSQWINSSHAPHPFMDVKPELVFNQGLHDLHACQRMLHGVFDWNLENGHGSRQLAMNCGSSELERFEFGSY